MKTPKPIQDERGIALAMAMIVMEILTSLMIAFAVLATSESQSASSQMASAQARALDESGVERALWAMTTGESSPGASGVLVLDAIYSLPSPVPSPYDGSTFVAVNDRAPQDRIVHGDEDRAVVGRRHRARQAVDCVEHEHTAPAGIALSRRPCPRRPPH